MGVLKNNAESIEYLTRYSSAFQSLMGYFIIGMFTSHDQYSIGSDLITLNRELVGLKERFRKETEVREVVFL